MLQMIVSQKLMSRTSLFEKMQDSDRLYIISEGRGAKHTRRNHPVNQLGLVANPRVLGDESGAITSLFPLPIFRSKGQGMIKKLTKKLPGVHWI